MASDCGVVITIQCVDLTAEGIERFKQRYLAALAEDGYGEPVVMLEQPPAVVRLNYRDWDWLMRALDRGKGR